MEVPEKQKGMMAGEGTATRVSPPVLVETPRGTHFCHFYGVREELVDLLRLYFRKGLEEDDLCVYVSSKSFDEDYAVSRFFTALADVPGVARTGRVEIICGKDWFFNDSGFSRQRVLERWVAKFQEAKGKGFGGMTVACDNGWVERGDWEDLLLYEETLTGLVERFGMRAVCSYPLERYRADEVLDVARGHHFALENRRGVWTCLENRGMKTSAWPAHDSGLSGANGEPGSECLYTPLLSRKGEDLKTLAGGVAHQFNNILTVTMGYAQLLLMCLEEKDSHRAYVQPIISAAERGARLTKGLLAFCGAAQVSLRRTDVNTVLEAVEKWLGFNMPSVIEVRMVYSEQPLKIMVDADRMVEILCNMALNARDAMRCGGRLTISCRPFVLDSLFVNRHGFGQDGATYVLITVEDSGHGMEEEVAARLFEPFFTTKNMGANIGLSLATAQGIMASQRGYIRFRTGVGKGTTFEIFLPLAGEADEREIG